MKEDDNYIEGIFGYLAKIALYIVVVWLFSWVLMKIQDSQVKPEPKQYYTYDEVVQISKEIRKAKGYKVIEEPKQKRTVTYSQKDQFSDYEEIINYEGWESWD